MPLRRKGSHLLRVDGHLANHADCCCGGTCCTLDPPRTLYLTIDNVSVPGCPECEGWTVAAAAQFFGGTTSSTATGTTWLTEELGNHGSLFLSLSLVCDVIIGSGSEEHLQEGVPHGTHWMRSNGQNFYYGNGIENPPTCTFQVAEYDLDVNEYWPVGLAVCDPFYLQGTVTIIFHDLDTHEEICTGTMRVTITE